MKIIYLLLIDVFIFCIGVKGQTLITESFDYTPSSTYDLSTQSSGAWEMIEETGSPVWVTAGSLSYPGAPETMGNKISFEGGTKRYDLSYAVPAEDKDDGTIYTSFMFRVTALPSSPGVDYFIYFGNSVAGVVCPVYLRTGTDGGNFNIGLGKRNNLAVTWIDKDLNVGETYYVVFSLTRVDGNNNDIAKMWLNPAPGQDPKEDVSISEGADLGNFRALKRIVLNHSNDKNAGLKMDIDEINVSDKWIELTASPDVPSAPSVLIASSAGESRIDLNWADNSTDETGFEIERSSDGVTFESIYTAAANTTAYTDNDLTASTVYYYRVRALGAANNSDYSNIAFAVTAGEVQTLITESFDYTPSSTHDLSTQSNGAWEMIDATGTPVWVTTGNLSYPGAQAATGNKIAFEGGTKRYDLSYIVPVEDKDDGTIYTSFMFRVTALPSESSGDYFIYFGNSVAGVVCPVYLRTGTVSGKFNLGFGKRNKLAVTWINEDLNVGETYYVVFSLTRVDGNSNDIAKMWLNPAPGPRPQEDVSISDGADLGNFLALKRIVINHSNNENTGLKMDIDEINVSDKWIALIAAAAPPPAPSELTAVAGDGTKIDLGWTDNSDDEAGFDIERSLDGVSFDYLTTVAANTTSYTDEASAEFTKYYYRVRAKNAGGNSEYSNTANATTKSLPPQVPAAFKVIAVSPNTINLSWEYGSDKETGFELERSTDGTSFLLITTLPANTESYSDVGLTSLTTYYYRIRATGVSLNSDYSDIDSAVTPASVPLSPEGLTVTVAPSREEIILNWTDNSDNESWFEVERSSDGTNFILISTVPSNTVSYIDNNLGQVAQYYYRVRSTGIAGSSDYSNIANIAVPKQSGKAIEAVNVITPNGDGRNDLWIIKHIEEYPGNRVSVFDRLGRLVFQRKDYSNNWDGTDKGGLLPNGAYFYVIELGQGIAPIKGMLTIIH